MLDQKTIGRTPGPLSGAFSFFRIAISGGPEMAPGFTVSGGLDMAPGFTVSGGLDMAPGFTISVGPEMAPALPQSADTRP